MEPSENVVTEPYEDDCKVHGHFRSEAILMPFGSKIRKGCPACSAAHKARQQEADAQLLAREAEAFEQRRIGRRRAAGVPVRYDAKTLDSYDAQSDGQKRALASAKRVVEAIQSGKEAPNLIFSGKPGTGKSHLSCGIILALYRSHTVCRIDLPDLIREIRATWRRDSDRTEENVLDWYGSIDLLILEEVGTGAGSDDERARVFQVVNRRYEAMLPTIVVTNLAMPELTAEMGERVIDRLREGDKALVVFDWESARK